MINLLPERGRRVVRRAHMLHLASAALVCAAILFAIGAGALLPSFFLARAKEQAALTEQAAFTAHSTGSEEVTAPLAEAAIIARGLAERLDATRPTTLLADIIAVRGTGILLTRMEIRSKVQGVEALLQGEAAAREDLIRFKKSIEELQGVSDVVLPVGNLAKSAAIPFSITVRMSTPQ